MMNKTEKRYSEDEIEGVLREHFSVHKMDVTPREDILENIISGQCSLQTLHRESARPSPYFSFLFKSHASQRFAFSFAALLLVVGAAAGALETEVFSGSVNNLSARIPAVHEALSVQVEEIMNQRERTKDDEDFAAPEAEADPLLKSFDVYGETTAS